MATVRLAKSQDVPLLRDVELSAAQRFLTSEKHAGFANGRTMPVETLQSAVAQNQLWVAVDHLDAPLGFIALTPLTHSLHIDELSVRYEWQGKGLGHALLQTVLDYAANRTVSLTTDCGPPWNAPFYARHGFMEIALDACPDDLAVILTHDKLHSPQAEDRIAMIKVNSATTNA